MKFTKTLQDLLNIPGDQAPLQKGSGFSSGVRALQILLYSLGFGETLNWQKYRADGDYGAGTGKAIQLFLEKNGLDGDGQSLARPALQLMLKRYELLPAVLHLKQSLEAGTLATVYADGQESRNDLQRLAAVSGVSLAEATPTEAEARALLEAAQQWFGDGWDNAAPPSGRKIEPVVSANPTAFIVRDPWFSVTFKKYKRGVFHPGDTSPSDFIASGRQDLLDHNLSESAIRVISPVSDNEGKLEAINTWDNAFLTFGMFQWTIGAESSAGELPALLQRIKNDYPDAFEEFYGQYGLDVANASQTLGFLALNGKKLDSVAEKELLRKDILWAYRFWKSGLDPRVQLTQIVHALTRINSFRRHSDYRPLGKFFIDDLLTSEYGMCLLLDHHVNRPGHLMNYAIGKMDILGQALRNARLADSNPAGWGTAEEQKLIEAYLPLRYASNMTHGQARAQRIKAALDRGELSAERHSFVLEAIRSRGSAGPSEADFPRINHKEYEDRTALPI